MNLERYLHLSSLLIFSLTALSQSDLNNDPNFIPHPKEIPAEFPGGADSLLCYIESHWDQSLINQIDSGTIIIEVEIDTTGRIGRITFNLGDNRSGLNRFDLIQNQKVEDEIRRVFHSMPKWKPNTVEGFRTRSEMTWMIRFPYEPKCERKTNANRVDGPATNR